MKKILVIFLILVGLYLIWTNLYRIPWLPFGNSGDSLPITEKIEEIEVDISSISTTVIPEDRDDIKAELKGKGEVHVSKSGDTVEVTYERGFFNWSWLPFFNNSKLTVYIPEDYNRDMSLRVGSGHLEFAGSKMELKELTVEVHSGNVHLQEIVVNKLDQDVASGNSKLENITAESGEIEVRSGNVTLEKYTGKLDAEINSGRLKATIADLTDTIDVRVNSGLLDLDVPNDADFTLNGKVNSGYISSDLSLDDSVRDKKEVRGKHGAGTHEVNIKVNSGKASIQ